MRYSIPKNNKITGQKWKDCDRCGLSWPKAQLRRESETGSKVCPNCYDSPQPKHFPIRHETGREVC